MQSKPKISYFILIGDSLGDRGTLAKKKLGCFSMNFFSGLQGRSPKGRFTNGYVWCDYFIAAIAHMFMIQQILKNKKLDATDIADALINNDKKLRPLLKNTFSLSDDTKARYGDRVFVRTYNEGGLTAHDYSWHFSFNISRFISRIILTTLEDKRKELLAYDEANQINDKHKAKTLIIEWSGANDLITVNARPSKKESDLAVIDRINNVKALIQSGYRHFALINLPDLSLTPRYQAKSEKERKNAEKWSLYFNEQLALACKALQKENAHCKITLLDVNKEFTDMYMHPEKYKLDKKKNNIPYTKSPEFKILKNGTSPAEGSMFFDDVHPTTDASTSIAAKFVENYMTLYHFVPPSTEDEKQVKKSRELYKTFKRTYKGKSSEEAFEAKWLKMSERQANIAIKRLLMAAYKNKSDSNLIRTVMQELNWMDTEGELNMSIPAIRNARNAIDQEMEIKNNRLAFKMA